MSTPLTFSVKLHARRPSPAVTLALATVANARNRTCESTHQCIRDALSAAEESIAPVVIIVESYVMTVVTAAPVTILVKFDVIIPNAVSTAVTLVPRASRSVPGGANIKVTVFSHVLQLASDCLATSGAQMCYLVDTSALEYVENHVRPDFANFAQIRETPELI